ncbi:nucleotide disphospho-sugar-binding domain-containing protein [Streptomyces sp. ME19-01-6]|uniref:nucleotide disphospho-sugar-binding domain-containing protein n=1 Tax=Streptomyces sp. ME19-01-6 TaxID=3028686 RepID=UPI0029B7EB82|nr:nucleotide disphospho-sugar-binding domain-containing protein [Streptomyces sp. ME19-01-6]MDX3229762.1 DUF1205 domain-containing protein [Streptomyces sp. ME19-01-6]
MRVLFATWAEPGHLFSLVPLAWACRAAGHEVRLAAPPSCMASAARAGLTGVPVGRDVAVEQIRSRADLAPWRSPGRWPEGWASRPALLDDAQHTVLRALADKQFGVADAMAGDLLAFARHWRPDVVVHDALCFAGTVAAAALGVPAYGHGWGTATIMRVENHELGARPLPGHSRLFERHGVPPRSGPTAWFDPFPPALRLPDPAPRTRIDVRYVPYNGPGDVERWVLEERARPRVCITAGVSGHKVRPGALPPLLTRTASALAGRGLEVVLAISADQARKLTAAPAKARVAVGLPMSELLPTCAAVVHHGGSGTGLTAAAAGTPQLVLNQVPVTAEIGERLHRHGAGLILPPERQSDPVAVSEAVEALVDDPRHARAAARLRTDMLRMPSPADRVTALEEAAV